MKEKILAIYVVYNPDMSLLKKQLDIVKKNVDEIWITDNSKDIHDLSDGKIRYSHQLYNKGIAYAQNLGIKYAIENGFDWIVFFDQDSSFSDGFLDVLLCSFKLVLTYDRNAYGIGPSAINRDSGARLNKKSLLETINIGSHHLIKVRELMCSSSIIKVCLFEQVGFMDEGLFIDGVDFEICWRAQRDINANFYITEDCELTHQLGEGDKKIMGRNTHIPTPFRTFYQVRNCIILSKRSYVPLKWKMNELIKTMAKAILFPIFLQPRKAYANAIIKGFCQGFGFK